jgi:SPP1 gp7 family putative phage head morphogenesis protein
MRPFQLPSNITLEAWKALVLQLDPDNDEAEQLARMAIERRTERQMAQSLEDWLRSVLSGISEAEVQTIAYRLRSGSMRFRDVLQRALIDSVDLGVSVTVNQFENIGFGFDYTLANADAREWARRYTDEVMEQLNVTNDRIVGEAVARWVENGEPLQALEDDLARHFNRQRARRIAATETTRAYAEGNRAAFQESGVVDEVQWRTANDERVCPICGPLHDQRAPVNGAFDNGLFPPAHPNCRCWVVPVIDK